MSDLAERKGSMLPSRLEMEQAFFERDARWDGLFFAAVTSTRIFCRPSCPARKPKPENLEFYSSAREALFAGFRPCLRCKPLEDAADPPWLARLLAMVDAEPDRRFRDGELAEAGIDPVAARRFFQKRHGMSFQAYSRARRLGRAFEAIRGGAPLDDAMLERGWDSFSGFREAFARHFGAPPGRAARAGSSGSKGGAAADFVRLGWIETPIGPMVAGAVEGGLCLLEFSDRRMLETQLDILRGRFGSPLVPGESPWFERLRAELAAYFSGAARGFSVPLVLKGTAFEERVWRGLMAIPPGRTATYAELAGAIGSPGASRAVGRANGFNRIAILVPCHRVVRSGYPGAASQRAGSAVGAALGLAAPGLIEPGRLPEPNPDAPEALESLGGYGGGLWRKRALLEIEAGLRRY